MNVKRSSSTSKSLDAADPELEAEWHPDRRVSATNNLLVANPDLASQWHPDKNYPRTPASVTPHSSEKVWWVCPNDPTHEWEATVKNRSNGTGCPECTGRRASPTNSLAVVNPALAAEWHPARNGSFTPAEVTPGADRKVWWRCSAGHEWEATVRSRSKGGTCRECNSLAVVNPALAAEWHPVKNYPDTPADVTSKSSRKVWWLCSAGHEWEASVYNRSNGGGCGYCGGRHVSASNSLAVVNPALAAEWHPARNGSLTPADVRPGSKREVWWVCPNDPTHEWPAPVKARSRGSGCPYCSGNRVSATNNLAVVDPVLAAEWHPVKNGLLTPAEVTAGTDQKVWWLCRVDPTHEWEASVYNRSGGNRSGCPICVMGWTLPKLRLFVRSIADNIHALDPAELYTLFQQNGLLDAQGKASGFVRVAVGGRVPPEEWKKFADEQPSEIDALVGDLLAPDADDDTERAGDEPLDATGTLDDEVGDPGGGDEGYLPLVETTASLGALGAVTANADAEAAEFFVASACAKIWRHAFVAEDEAVAQAQAFASDSGYQEEVREAFLDEWKRARALEIPAGYSFRVDGTTTEPNLMQRLAAVRVRDQMRVGNWSGTGAGKTLSAALAARVCDAKLTIVCCPNAVVDGWKRELVHIFPDSEVVTKPTIEQLDHLSPVSDAHRYLVMHYEWFQQPDSEWKVARLIEVLNRIDFVVVDEIHQAKQRTVENLSQRRRLVTALIASAREKNAELRVLGMSATPVINTLEEGKSLIELITSLHFDDLPTNPTVANAMSLHGHLVRLGIRYQHEESSRLVEKAIPVDVSHRLDEVRALGSGGSKMLALEELLTEERLPAIVSELERGTVVYTHYVGGNIIPLLHDAIVAAGWRVDFYTGENKAGLERFLAGDVDVLIGSQPITTGVDRLQTVSKKLIINTLPWTHAEYMQLRGRIQRQGQKEDEVTVVLPVTFAEVNGERWSWCDSKLNRIHFKKSLADAALDGVIPEERHFRTPEQALRDTFAWLERLESGDSLTVSRRPIVIPLATQDTAATAIRRYGELSVINHRWNTSKSSTTHDTLTDDPALWEHYHGLYRKARESWSVIPYQVFVEWISKRSSLQIGDFGCGEALLAREVMALERGHTVHSFDHVAVDENVVSCDICDVPLEDESLDLAIFSLSLMGSNFTDYLREAHRALKLDGQLLMAEATSRFGDIDLFCSGLHRLGFDIVERAEQRAQFTFIRAVKSDRSADADLVMRFADERSSAEAA